MEFNQQLVSVNKLESLVPSAAWNQAGTTFPAVEGLSVEYGIG
jgi:hypothetical protein